MMGPVLRGFVCDKYISYIKFGQYYLFSPFTFIRFTDAK